MLYFFQLAFFPVNDLQRAVHSDVSDTWSHALGTLRKNVQKYISYEEAYKRSFQNIHFSTGKQEPEVCLPPGLVLVHKQEIIRFISPS